jgi:hypothetical protein
MYKYIWVLSGLGVTHPFVCTVEGCEMKFRQRFRWAHHVDYHTRGQVPEKRFACSECGKSYDSSNSLQRHISSHTGKLTSGVGRLSVFRE